MLQVGYAAEIIYTRQTYMTIESGNLKTVRNIEA